MQKVKLGQMIRFQSDHYISLEKGGKILVKKGDTARVIKKVDEKTGEIMYLTGEAKGKYQNLMLQVEDDLDADAIAKQILNDIQNG
ncbi:MULTISPECIES: hypothetical protein [Clostridium]|uniref:hypothetical protein n=1 Tax=Clostridium TaxID=1485 RepID=UPI00069E3528|nr:MULTISPECIES: hypothetical protein [Clostridium]KOF56165.1 hypothetical protein AGR56_04460 [Clostridium sp. DMHC 10]MCD2348217.1 hypothetical protein [Clostridium guangxiense]